MKKTKRMLAFLLAVVMTMAMTVMVSADTETYTISEKSGSAVTYTVYQLLIGDVAEDDVTLSNIVAGKNLSSEIDAETFADNISKLSDANATQYAYECLDTNNGAYGYLNEGNGYTLGDVPSGYYLLIADDGSLYILEVIGKDVEIDPKTSGSTSGDKSIVNSGSENESGDDVAIGDDVQFSLTATLPANFSEYTVYKLIFTDTMSDGLTYKSVDSVTIGEVAYHLNEGNIEDGGGNVIGTYFYNNDVLTITFTNLVGIDGAENGAKVEVKYTATLNENATTGSNANTNEVEIEYSNNPNDTSSTDTFEDIVYVYTFEVTVNKTDGESALNGAAFTLYEYVDGDWVEVSTLSYGSTFVFTGLDAGSYKLVESTTPDGYNTADDIYFTIAAEYENDGQLSSVKIYECNEDGEATTKKSGSVAADGTSFAISTTVVNEAGVELPETGGMGTTILYIAGIALVLFAGVALITKKRMAR